MNSKLHAVCDGEGRPDSARHHPLHPAKANCKVQYHYDKAVYKKRHLVENLFAKIKDWRRIHTRYDRCAHTFMSAIAIAAIVIFWI